MATYTEIKLIGRGGFGAVEEVKDEKDNRFARKTFAPSSTISAGFHDKLRKRFRREVLTQQELGGSEIIPVLDHDLSGSEPWFIMPLAEKTYTEEIADNKSAGSVEIEPIADILNSLQRLHDERYVHRDLNPNNILFHDGAWKLSDLGAVLPPSGQTMTLTEDTIIFTEKYCAPEQRQDFHNAQASADIYSFGCILHDLFGQYDRTPYAKHSATGGMGVIIEKCTDPKPDRRPSLKILRSLVLDTLFEEGGHCEVDDEEANKWLEKLDSVNDWIDADYDDFARFFATLDTEERTEGLENEWVYSLSTPFLTRLPSEALKKIVERGDGISSAIVEKYCYWAASTRFLFNFADSVCGRLTTIFDHGTPSDQALAFASLVQLAESHNRWYIMRCVVRRSKEDVIDSGLAKRMAIELMTEELEWSFKRCVLTIKEEPSSLSPALAKICD
ncbi:protein kinase [Verrucomicrobiaceae bacterium 5K15]|uniref:Protein kinase n=1 Tax=Oceaniferula flava TaxID=2800421 RepID=A0AAE2SEF9_9BACT|nr:protein kinase [Oceaniferula flavus]MBK1855482.1 protein kinase [Oceaniferula flavus]MBM1136788.1 protein kinase [Oceaniferula flavus]